MHKAAAMVDNDHDYIYLQQHPNWGQPEAENKIRGLNHEHIKRDKFNDLPLVHWHHQNTPKLLI